MTEALIVSNLLLWLGLLVLGGVVLALTRQIGLLHERLGPFGALAASEGPKVGEPAPELRLADLAGTPVRIGGEQSDARTLLFFLSPDCPVCDGLLPALRSVVREEPRVRLVVASDGDPAEHRAFVARQGLESEHYVLSTELGLRFAIGKLPSAVLIDERGIVRAKGMVNSREHLESLFAAEELGVASIQDYLARDDAPRQRKVGRGRS